MLEGYLCDELTGVICSENYRNNTYDLGYKNIYEEFWKLHNMYQSNISEYSDSSKDLKSKEKIRDYCENKRETLKNSFQQDLLSCSSASKDIILGKLKEYHERLEREEDISLAKRVCEYPYGVKIHRLTKIGEW